MIREGARGGGAGEPEASFARLGQLGHLDSRRFVGGQDGHSVRSEAGEYLALGTRHRHRASPASQVRGRHVGHHRDVGLGDASQSGDLARRPHGHLQHPELLLPGRFQHRQGQSHVGVQVALSTQYLARGRERRGDEFLGRGLSVGTSHAHHPALVLLARGRRQVPQRPRGSATAMTGIPLQPAGRPRPAATTTAAAPAWAAAPQKSKPSTRSPGRAKKRRPGFTSRLSLAAPANRVVASAVGVPTTVPPVALHANARVRFAGFVTRHLREPRGRRGPRRNGGDLAIIEVDLLRAQDLVVLVALARNQQGVARPRESHGQCDGGSAVGLHVEAREALPQFRGGSVNDAGLFHAGHNHIKDCGLLLGARVVRGDHHHIGAFGSGLAHTRPLALVAVAAAPEHDQDAACAQRPQHIEGRSSASGVCA